MACRSIDIVVAHYNEDLSWLNGVAEDCIIYAKGVPPRLNMGFSILQLPNIGKEGHTYLHHVVTHYDQLAAVTLFVQGRIEDHVAWSIHDMKDACLNLDKRKVLTFPSTDIISTELVRFDEWHGIEWDSHPCLAPWAALAMKPATHTPADYFARFFGNGRVPLYTGYTSGAIFAVPRELILSHALETYQGLLKDMFLGPMEHWNPETGFYMERFWLAMWQPDEYVCWNEDEISVVERRVDGQLAKGRWRPISKPSESSEDSG